jgi:hypothetical protein
LLVTLLDGEVMGAAANAFLLKQVLLLWWL